MEEIVNVKKIFGFNSDELMQLMVKVGTNLIITIVIFIIGFWLANFASRTVKKILTKSNTDVGLTTFLVSLLSIVLKVLVTITGINQLGIEMTSFVAILGAAGLAIGMAFSGTLSNFAGGVMILVFKPFKVGDFVMTQNEQGIVKEIQIFNTYLHTTDNKVIILPNGPVANGNIINFTKADKRRVDWVFSISYGDDLTVAKNLLNQFINDEKRILSDPEPFVGLGALADSSVNITVRAWVMTDDFWPVFFEMNERVYNEFKNHNLHIPFPQMDVHIKQS
jgi:small conductance mechanosensitive channel